MRKTLHIIGFLPGVTLQIIGTIIMIIGFAVTMIGYAVKLLGVLMSGVLLIIRLFGRRF